MEKLVGRLITWNRVLGRSSRFYNPGVHVCVSPTRWLGHWDTWKPGHWDTVTLGHYNTHHRGIGGMSKGDMMYSPFCEVWDSGRPSCTNLIDLAQDRPVMCSANRNLFSSNVRSSTYKKICCYDHYTTQPTTMVHLLQIFSTLLLSKYDFIRIFIFLI